MEGPKKGKGIAGTLIYAGLTLSILVMLTGCASAQFTQILNSLLGTSSEAEEKLGIIKDNFSKAQQAGISKTYEAFGSIDYEWGYSTNEAIWGIRNSESGKESYPEHKADFEALASEIVLAYEQYLSDCLNASEDPYYVYKAIFDFINNSYFQSRMKDPEALFNLATKKWANAQANKVKDLGNGSARSYVSSTGLGLCWFGNAAISAKAVDYSKLKWVYDDASKNINASFITKVIPDNYLRFGPDKVAIYYQLGSQNMLLREFPVNTDGKSDEYTMSFPLKLLETEIKNVAKGSDTFTGDYVCVSAYYIIKELERETTLAKGSFFLKLK